MNLANPSLTVNQALSLLPDGKRIHTLRGDNMAMLGCNRDRAFIVSAIETTEHRRFSGEAARFMGHGLCIDMDGALFIATDDAALMALEASLCGEAEPKPEILPWTPERHAELKAAWEEWLGNDVIPCPEEVVDSLSDVLAAIERVLALSEGWIAGGMMRSMDATVRARCGEAVRAAVVGATVNP